MNKIGKPPKKSGAHRSAPPKPAAQTVWPVQDAKARFSEMLDRAIAQGPQLVTRRGVETAVLVPIAEWRRLSEPGRPTLKELLLAPEPRFENLIPPRGKVKLRPPVKFE